MLLILQSLSNVEWEAVLVCRNLRGNQNDQESYRCCCNKYSTLEFGMYDSLPSRNHLGPYLIPYGQLLNDFHGFHYSFSRLGFHDD